MRVPGVSRSPTFIPPWIWAPVSAVAGQKIERVLVLGEDEELHLRVFEDAVVGDEFLELGELGLDFLVFEFARPVNELAQFDDFLLQVGGVHRGDHVFQVGNDLLPLLVGQVLEVFRQAFVDLLLAVAHVRASPSCAPGCGARRRCLTRTGAATWPW
jgi:hypothetical protein